MQERNARRGRGRPAFGRLSLRVIKPSEEARAESDHRLAAWAFALRVAGLYWRHSNLTGINGALRDA